MTARSDPDQNDQPVTAFSPPSMPKGRPESASHPPRSPSPAEDGRGAEESPARQDEDAGVQASSAVEAPPAEGDRADTDLHWFPAGRSAPSDGRAAGRVIAIANQKGGVGKSTTAVNLGACLAEAGRRILVVDLDPQGNASTGLGIDHTARTGSAYEVLTANIRIQDAIVATSVDGLWAVPSTIDLAGAEIELVTQFNREARLARALDGVRSEFDFILLDCPPSLGLLTVNALTAADELIVPIQCEYYALEGLGQLLKNVRLVQQNVNPSLRLTGIVMTMFDGRTKLAEQVVQEVRSYFGPRVYESVIPRSIRLAEAPGFGQPITQYDPSSRGARAYKALASELLTKPPGNGLDDEALEQISQGPPLMFTPETTSEMGGGPPPSTRPAEPPTATAETEQPAPEVEAVDPAEPGLRMKTSTRIRTRARPRVEAERAAPRPMVETAPKTQVPDEASEEDERSERLDEDLLAVEAEPREEAEPPFEGPGAPEPEAGQKRRRRWPFSKGG